MANIHERLSAITRGNTSGSGILGRSGGYGGRLVPERDSSFEVDEHLARLSPHAYEHQLDLYGRALSGETPSETAEKAVSGLGHTSITGANSNGDTLVPRPRTETEVAPANATSTMVPQAAKVSAAYL